MRKLPSQTLLFPAVTDITDDTRLPAVFSHIEQTLHIHLWECFSSVAFPRCQPDKRLQACGSAIGQESVVVVVVV